MSAAVFHRRRLLSDWSALRGASRLRKGEGVGRDEQDGSRGRTQLLSSAAFIISIKKGPPRQADTEVCSDEEQYSRSIRCCETFCPLFSSAILSVFFSFLNESRSVWASHPAGSGDVGAHSWEQSGR